MGLLNQRPERHSGMRMLVLGLIAIIGGVAAFLGGACDLLW